MGQGCTSSRYQRLGFARPFAATPPSDTLVAAADYVVATVPPIWHEVVTTAAARQRRVAGTGRRPPAQALDRPQCSRS